MKTKITLSNGMTIESAKSVLDALHFNGLFEARITGEGQGTCIWRDERTVLTFTF